MMAIELQMLAWAVALGLVQLLLAAAAMTWQRGLAWNAGPRDGEAAPLRGVAARLDRTSRNFLETFPLFAALALAVVLAGRGDDHTALAAQVYFWARVAYVPLYVLGIPYVRSVVWTVAFWGILQLLWALL